MTSISPYLLNGQEVVEITGEAGAVHGGPGGSQQQQLYSRGQKYVHESATAVPACLVDIGPPEVTCEALPFPPALGAHQGQDPSPSLLPGEPGLGHRRSDSPRTVYLASTLLIVFKRILKLSKVQMR